jgi:hypothetical protein
MPKTAHLGDLAILMPLGIYHFVWDGQFFSLDNSLPSSRGTKQVFYKHGIWYQYFVSFCINLTTPYIQALSAQRYTTKSLMAIKVTLGRSGARHDYPMSSCNYGEQNVCSLQSTEHSIVPDHHE